MIGPSEESLWSETLSTLIPLCIGAAVLTGIYQAALWMLRMVRRRLLSQRDDRRQRVGSV